MTIPHKANWEKLWSSISNQFNVEGWNKNNQLEKGEKYDLNQLRLTC